MNRIDKHQLLCNILLIARSLYLVFGINICFIFSRTRLPGHVLGLGHIILETFLTIILAFVHKLKYSNEVDENLKWLQKDNSSKRQHNTYLKIRSQTEINDFEYLSMLQLHFTSSTESFHPYESIITFGISRDNLHSNIWMILSP